MATKEELWAMPLADLVDETLPKVREAHGPDYTHMARAVLTFAPLLVECVVALRFDTQTNAPRPGAWKR